MKRKYRIIAIISLMIAGCLAILTGILGNPPQGNAANKLFYVIVSVSGGAVFGGTLTMLIEQIFGSEIIDIRDYLFRNEKFESIPDNLNVVARDWHVYYQTVKDDNLLWVHSLYHLKNGKNGNSIIGDYEVLDRKQKKRKYFIEAGIRGDNLVLISRSEEGAENESIEIVPKVLQTHLELYIGIQVLESWDGLLMYGHCIYSPMEIVDANSEEFQERLNVILKDTLAKYKISTDALCVGR